MAGLIVLSEERQWRKDFKNEVRGCLDIDHLVAQAVFRLDKMEDDLNNIIMSMIVEMAHRSGECFDVPLIKKEFYSFDRETGQRVARRMQAYDETDGGINIRQNWMIVFGSIDGPLHRHIGMTRLRDPTNLGVGMEEIQMILLVITPKRDKGTKSALETARSFASLLLDDLLRIELMHAPDVVSCKEILCTAATVTSSSESGYSIRFDKDEDRSEDKGSWRPLSGIKGDFHRRWKRYKSDWIDGVRDVQSISKSISTIFFLLCTILPTSIAYGMLNDVNTTGLINVQKVVIGQAIGGVFFSIFGGQPMLILSTTAPLSIYIHVIYNISLSTNWPFYNLYVCVGLWAQVFLALAACLQAANLLQYTRRSTEEMFSLFIATALTYKAVKALYFSYASNYIPCFNQSISIDSDLSKGCLPHAALLFALLALLTFWLSITLESFRNTPFLSRCIRNLLSDYAVPLAMVIMAAIARFLFFNLPKETFNLYTTSDLFFTEFWSLPLFAHLICIILAIPLSVLFFVDQLLVTKTVDNKQNKLQKGSAHHWDLLIVAVLNVFLSLFCVPWMHAALPSAFLHLRSLADVEERVHDGRVQQVITTARETRTSTLVAHIIMVFIYIYGLKFISDYVPTALFQGLFLYMAVSSLGSNQFWHRLLLIFTEQRAYPPTSYIRRVPQRVIHTFTLLQFIQLLVLLLIGLSSYYYISMLFPLVIALFVPIRLFIMPLIFYNSHLEVIDGCH